MEVDEQFERLDQYPHELEIQEAKASQIQGKSIRRRSISRSGPSQSTLQFLKKEDEKFKKGVETAKDILKDVKLMNMKLDDISGLVKLQRQKLLNMQDKIKKSQNYMDRSKKLLTTFSKEIYGDKIILSLGILIGIVLVCIGIASIKYKLRANEMIMTNEEFIKSEEDFNEIDEKLFFKEDFIESAQENFTDIKKSIGALFANSFLKTQAKVKKDIEEKRANGEDVKETKMIWKSTNSKNHFSKDNFWQQNSNSGAQIFQNREGAQRFNTEVKALNQKIGKVMKNEGIDKNLNNVAAKKFEKINFDDDEKKGEGESRVGPTEDTGCAEKRMLL